MCNRSWMVITLLVFAVHCAGAQAQDRREGRSIWEDDGEIYPGWLCLECRDVYEHPEDYAAFAWNAYFGEHPWAWNSRLGIPFRVYNMDMQWVVVWFTDFVFDTPDFMPETMNVRIRLPNGVIITIELLENGPDLYVDPPPPPPTPVCSCGDGGDGGEEGDDFDEADGEGELDDLPDWGGQDSLGIVDIVDPDEHGDFPDFEYEL
jgi:hypothetical protein